MKRDMDLCRKILLIIEADYYDKILQTIKVDGYSLAEVAYHCRILCDAGLLEGYKAIETRSGVIGFLIGPLTWNGHDFLDKIREDTIWNKTKGIISSHGLPMVIEVVQKISTTIISSMTEGAVKGIIQGTV